MKEKKVRKHSKLQERVSEIKRTGFIMNVFGFIPLIWSIALVALVVDFENSTAFNIHLFTPPEIVRKFV